jgi:uncharacterized protein
MSSHAAYRDALIAYIRHEARPAEKFSHQPRLYALATRVGSGEVYDDDVVFAASWLHDLGVFIGHRPEDPAALARWDNVAYAMDRARPILDRLGFPPTKIPAVIDAIRTHQPSAVPASIEGTILRDADILEQLGAIGILRTVCKIGRDTRFPTFVEAISSLRRALEDLPGRIQLPRARELAQPRINALRAFLAAVDSESFGILSI